MTPIFERIAVLGLGLLGGSLARAAKKNAAARRIAGWTRRRNILDAALRSGVVDAVGDPEELVGDADLVVLATPVFAMAQTLRSIAPHLHEGALVTDVGSVKGILHETLPHLLPRGVRYIGSHPMAGGHESGFEYSRPDLFEGAACIVTDCTATPERDRLCEFWRALGARIVIRDPSVHDVEVAWMSHLPHVLAYAFAGALAGAPPGARQVSGTGFRDFTRIAQSEPEMWGDILTANRKAIAAPLQAAAAALASLGRSIEANDADAVERTISSARTTLSQFLLKDESERIAPGEGHRARGKA